MQFLLLLTRNNIRLGQELGRGGEGAVFSIEGLKNQVAKVYSRPADYRKVQKLLRMAEAANPSLLKVAAWPVDLLIDSREAVHGFVMPRVVAHRDIHELYSPKSRSERFPDTDFRFLVHVGANIARAFALVHGQGHVLGDVNHGNLLVGRDGTVILIDCDSFQIVNGSSVFTCDVGVPLFTAPELHGHPFRGLVRTANHDLFGLAVLLFHLLYMGRHPFAGRYSGSGDMPIERAVAEHRFAYGPDRMVNGMERPPGTLPLETMGATIAQLFIGALGRDGSNGGRPEAKSWIEALEWLESQLLICSKASWHHYPRHLVTCPWCTVEAQTGVRLFGHRIEWTHTPDAIDLGALWQAISAVPDPGIDPTLPSERPWLLPRNVKVPSGHLKSIRKTLSLGLVCAGLAACSALGKDGGLMTALILYGLGFAIWPRVSVEKRTAVERAYSTAKTEWEAALARWNREATRTNFAAKANSLEKARAELGDLPNERRRRLAKLETERQVHQLQCYLDRFRIDRAQIHGIGGGRTSMLASYGIETAADIDRAIIIQIPGFGETLTSELVQWRYSHQRNFRFNPAEPVERSKIAAMDRDLEAQRQRLLSVLSYGPDLLRRLSQEITAARPRLMPTLEDAWISYKTAEAQLKAL